MELVAIDNLIRQGYTAYCPQMLKVKQRRQRWLKIIEPLFPRYLFLQLEVGVDNFAPIRSTMGVQDMVRFASEPATISEHAIEAIQQQEFSLLKKTENHYTWKHGDRVEVIDGPFAGLNGIFEKENNKERIIILFEMLGRKNRVTVNAHSVVLA